MNHRSTVSPFDTAVTKLLHAEVATKSAAATVAFFFMALLAFFYYFDTSENAAMIRAFALVAMISSVIRFVVSKKMIQNPDQDGLWLTLKTAVLVNGLSWGVIFTATAEELRYSGTDYTVSLLILTAFIFGSLATLAYDKWLFFPFQVAILLPQIILTVMMGLSTGNSDFYALTFIFLISFLYQLKQFKEFHGTIHSRFTQHVALEESHAALTSQTVKLIHTSRVAALGEMSGGLSHEINNALMVVSGCAHHIERALKFENVETAKFDKYLVHLRNATRKIEQVVEGLKFFALEMDSAKKGPVEIQAIVEKTLGLCREMIIVKTIDFRVSDIPKRKLNCRFIQISQILFTLLRNAYDSLATVTDPSERWIHLNVFERGNELFIEVSNGGPKISEEVSHRLFHPFFTTKDVGAGTGLSLCIAQGIAREHGGDLSLDVDAPHTTFLARFPFL